MDQYLDTQVAEPATHRAVRDTSAPAVAPADFHLRVFQATAHPERALAFQTSHEAVLAEFGLTGAIDSCLTPWWESPDSWMCIATETATGRDVAGMRIDIADRAEDLPAMVGIRKKGIPLPEGLGDGPFGEACAWWVAPEARKCSLPIQLMVVALASTPSSQIFGMIGLTPQHTLHYVEQTGFRRITSFGNEGTISYPRAPYLSTLVIVQDIERLSAADPTIRATIEAIRHADAPHRVETQVKDRTISFLHDLTPQGPTR